MDGYAVRAVDVASVPVALTRIGEVPAGSRFERTVGPGECVRIFTGAPLPAGTDAVVIQEDTEAEGRADESRVGKGCVNTCRSRRWLHISKKTRVRLEKD